MLISTITAAGWLAYRRGRVLAAAAARRNPCFPLDARMPLSQEFRAVRGLIRARDVPVRPIESTMEGTLWSTVLGLFWAPADASAEYVHRVSAEMVGGVYPLYALPPGATVLDVGANIGCFSRYVLQQGATRVIAFEPSPATVTCLRKNVQDIYVIAAGAWDSETTLAFNTRIPGNPGSHCVLEDGPGDTVIAATTIDKTVETLGLTNVHYLKMDIEGAEVRALRGATNTIRHFRPQLAIATEHTNDIIANTRNVIAAVRYIEPRYRYTVTESQLTRDASGRLAIIPYTLHFVC